MNDCWSEAIAERYSLALSDDLCDWFNGDWNRFDSSSEFCDFSVVPSLLNAAPSCFWPGFMLPDTIPIIGNRFGDWLCLKVGNDGKCCEIVHWYHGGGDYIPFGKTLAESLLYDACQSASPEHQTWGEVSEADPSKKNVLEWVAPRLDVSMSVLEEIISLYARGQVIEATDRMLEKGWCTTVAARDRIDAALSTPLRRKADPKLAMRLGVTWEKEMNRWLFDTDLIPAEQRERLHEILGASSDGFNQDWEAAEREAHAVLAHRQDLGWAFDIAGWAALRKSQTATAIDWWWKGVQTSVFSDQSTRFRSHWFDRSFGKFAAQQLHELRELLPNEIAMDPYWSALIATDAGDASQRITAHWIGRASQVGLSAGDCYDDWYRAGWDVGCHQVDLFAMILEQLTQNGRQAGWEAKAKIAKTYQARLAQRY